MSSYVGRYAELYDLFYGSKPYVDEAAFVHKCLQKHGTGQVQSLLELACGTGSHALAFEKFGYKIVATDYSQDMLNVARCKASQNASKVDFRYQDMRALELDQRFDAVICLFDAIGYVATNDALRQVFQGVHRHLRPGGLFIFDFWHAAAMLCRYEPLRIRRWLIPEGEVLRISETTLECEKQVCQVKYTVYELRSDGTYSSFTETQINRYFLIQEVAGWLSTYHFAPLKWFAGFSDDENITEQTWHVLSISRRL